MLLKKVPQGYRFLQLIVKGQGQEKYGPQILVPERQSEAYIEWPRPHHMTSYDEWLYEEVTKKLENVVMHRSKIDFQIFCIP